MVNDIKVVFIDIDNTLFDHIKKHKFDVKSIKALKRIKDNGVKLVVCSARPIYSLREFGVFDQLSFDGIIASNGAVRIYQDEWFDQYIFPKEKMKEIVKKCQEHNLCLECVTLYDRFYATEKNKDVDLHHKVFFENDSHVEKYSRQDVISALLFAKKEEDQWLKNNMPPEITFLRFSDYGLDVLCKLHNKGEAVRSMLKKMELTKDNALAFGDDVQDIFMFDEVKYPVAVENAKEEAKKHCAFVTKPVYQHGIYHFLKKNGFLKKKRI